MNFLKALRADLLTPEEKEELKTLEARYPDVPLDRTRIGDRYCSLESPLECSCGPLEADLIRCPAGNRFRDQEQRGP